MPVYGFFALYAALGGGGALAAEPAPATATPVPATIDSAVVQIFCKVRPPDLFRPWTKPAPSDVSGSGVVIDGKRILTNAHVVAYASEVQVQGSQGGDRITAKVAFFAPGIDLAVLTLEDEAFFRAHRPIARATALPTTKDAVLVYGYPTGGQTLSVTKGIVSRIEFAPYNFPTSGLRVQIDAAINPGNSGGPAVAGDKMVGIAFSRLKNAENIGYIIPNEEIELFLADIADGRYDGKPMLFEDYQTLENPALRTFLKLPAGARGVVVHHGTVDDGDSPLHRWDLITHIASTPISDQGEINLGGDVRVRFPYLVQRLGAKGEVPFSIIRDGRPMNVTIPVRTDRPLLIPTLHGQYPPYFIYGPLVFSVATQDFVNAMLGHAELVQALTALRSPLVTERFAKPSAEHEELVIVASPLFPHPIAKGYGSHAGVVLTAVNGQPIRSLRHLVGVLRDLKDELVVFEFAGRGGEALVFPRKDMVAATEAVLTDNGIREQASAELLAVWKGSGT
ncbi:MAG: trypsin-like peptidase domain-containing protein [Proteobacteria bacterium]|nr:trypsin-like peptidase domain-containing protein [Pseudomonadota bacterium]